MFDFINQASHALSTALSSMLDRIAEPQSGLVYLASTAAIGAAGAYFGALGAQRAINTAARSKRFGELLTAVNAAHSLTSVIFNQAASLKKQHFLPTLQSWEKERARVIDAIKQRKKLTSVAIHFETPPPIQFPINTLAELVYSKLTLNGRPLAALAELIQAEHTFRTLIEAQATLRKELEGNPTSDVVPRYLALETELGCDNRYRDICLGFVDVLDDLLFFSDVMGRDILDYGARVREAAPRRVRKRLPKLNVRVGIVPGNEYLVPNHEHHQQWYKNHVIVVPPKKVWFWRKWLHKLKPRSGKA